MFALIKFAHQFAHQFAHPVAGALMLQSVSPGREYTEQYPGGHRVRTVLYEASRDRHHYGAPSTSRRQRDQPVVAATARRTRVATDTSAELTPEIVAATIAWVRERMASEQEQQRSADDASPRQPKTSPRLVTLEPAAAQLVALRVWNHGYADGATTLLGRRVRTPSALPPALRSPAPPESAGVLSALEIVRSTMPLRSKLRGLRSLKAVRLERDRLASEATAAEAAARLEHQEHAEGLERERLEVELCAEAARREAERLERDRLADQVPNAWQGPRRVRTLELAARFDARQAALSIEAASLRQKLRTTNEHANRRHLARTLDGMQANRITVQPLRMGVLLSPTRFAQSHFQHTYALAGEQLGGPWRPLSRVEPEARDVDPEMPVAKRVWKLETSVWSERRRWADSGTFWDSEPSMRRALEADLTMARTGGGLDRLMCRHHLPTYEAAQKAGKGGARAPAAMVDSLIQQVFAALWTHHEILYVTFDIYAAQGGGDFTHIQQNVYKQLLADVEWIEKGAEELNAGVWDGLFVAINAVETVKAADDQYNHMKGLNRQEFVSFIVRAAIMRHIQFGTLSDVPEAIERLLAHDLLPRVRALNPGLAPPDDFRDLACYTEDTHDVISQFTPALRIIYQSYAFGANEGVGDKLHDRKLLGMDEWLELLEDLGWLDAQFGERLASLCFVLSRLRVCVEAELKGRTKLLQLSYEDWLEALVRVAASKALPTDNECENANVADGGEFMIRLQSQGYSAFFSRVDLTLCSSFRLMLDEDAGPLWGGLARQPAHRALEHLLTWMVRQMSGPSRTTSTLVARSELRLTFPDVAAFRKRNAFKHLEGL